jgi:hypothetical protein
MHCYVCAIADAVSPAVAICGVCSVGLCLEHLTENARRQGPGGMRAYACLHRPGYEGSPGGGRRAIVELDEASRAPSPSKGRRQAVRPALGTAGFGFSAVGEVP